MYTLHNLFIWIRKCLIRIILNEYPNLRLQSSKINSKQSDRFNIVSSTNNFWVSKSMYSRWEIYSNSKDFKLSIYSNQDVNDFMYSNFKDDFIYEIYRRSVIPVQKIDIFRICCIYIYGGIWLDLKSEVNLVKSFDIYKKHSSKGILLCEPRKIEVIKTINNKLTKSYENVIHNGFFFLPKGSKFLKHMMFKIKRDFIYFQDIDFKNPKQGIMNLTGPHQFTRAYHELRNEDKPILSSHKDLQWIYNSKFGEYISPFKNQKHYSSLKNLKTIDSNKNIYLN